MVDSPVSLDSLIAFVKVQRPEGNALDNLADAVAVAEHLGEQADHLVGHFVDQARRSGAPWSQIGASMGVSKQAAQQRFVPRIDPATGPWIPGDFSRFTLRARSVLTAAEDHARAADSAVIGSDHVALGLFAEPEGLAAKAITALGVTEPQVRAALGQPGSPPEQTQPSGAADAGASRVPLGPGATASLRGALRCALRLGHNYIGTEHILIGLLDENDATAGALAGLGLAKSPVERQLLAQVAAIQASRQ
ncbi:MAG TPA: Clp protease N-terminal domain-containing protein [Streptosporangiaceae bacterium]|nr:Clp protease N-terminal domain-containing protein [Streptosporangiaceae bacterium]